MNEKKWVRFPGFIDRKAGWIRDPRVIKTGGIDKETKGG